MSLFQIIAYYHEHFTNDANMRSPLRLSDVCPMFGLEMVRGSALAAWGGGGGAGNWEAGLHFCQLQEQALRSLASRCAAPFLPPLHLRRQARSCA